MIWCSSQGRYLKYTSHVQKFLKFFIATHWRTVARQMHLWDAFIWWHGKGQGILSSFFQIANLHDVENWQLQVFDMTGYIQRRFLYKEIRSFLTTEKVLWFRFPANIMTHLVSVQSTGINDYVTWYHVRIRKESEVFNE